MVMIIMVKTMEKVIKDGSENVHQMVAMVAILDGSDHGDGCGDEDDGFDGNS